MIMYCRIAGIWSYC